MDGIWIRNLGRAGRRLSTGCVVDVQVMLFVALFVVSVTESYSVAVDSMCAVWF